MAILVRGRSQRPRRESRAGSRLTFLCAKERSLSTCLRGQASHRDGIGSSPLRIEAGVSLLSDNDLLEGCPRRGHARRHRGLTRWRVHPCSSIGWTSPPSELDVRGARHEPSRPQVQRCASRVCLSTTLFGCGLHLDDQRRRRARVAIRGGARRSRRSPQKPEPDGCNGRAPASQRTASRTSTAPRSNAPPRLHHCASLLLGTTSTILGYRLGCAGWMPSKAEIKRVADPARLRSRSNVPGRARHLS
jgi:hypothetical protein